MKLNIGDNIKRLRREKILTQEEFSVILGVSYQSVSRWENGTCYPAGFPLRAMLEIISFLLIFIKAP